MVDYIGADQATRDHLIQRMLDKQEITEVLYRYCRGVDRVDMAALRSCYWPDAIENHGAYNGPVEGFFDFIPKWEVQHDGTHVIMNVNIEFQSDTVALVESYNRSFYYQKAGMLGMSPRDFPDAEFQDLEVAGRYLDRFERRDGEWRIAVRTLAIDWHTLRASGSVWDTTMFKKTRNRGRKFPDDPLYTVLPKSVEEHRQVKQGGLSFLLESEKDK